MHWTDNDKAMLASLWKAGLSSGKIAQRFGVSRSAIMGTINRMGLMGTERDIPANPVKPKPKPEPERHPVILVDLKKNGCLYAVTPDAARMHWFCNEPRLENSPYCKGHHVRCYNSRRT